jgi:hypothetical protein
MDLQLSRTLEGYPKDTGRVTDFVKRPLGNLRHGSVNRVLVGHGSVSWWRRAGGLAGPKL